MIDFLFEDIENLTNFNTCNDTNTSGIKRFGISPLVSATNMYYVRKKVKSKLNFLPHTEKSDKYIISSSVNHSPDDWTGYNPKVKSLFEYLSEKYLNDLRNRKALLLLDQSFEGYQTPWLWKWFHDECEKYNVSPECIVYVTGNMIVEDVYDEWVKNNDIKEKICVIGYPHFELDVAMNCEQKSLSDNKLPTFEDHIIHKTKNDIKTFSCLNKRIRPHRVWFYNYLYQSGILQDGLVSMNNFMEHGYWWEGKVMEIEIVKELNSSLPLKVYDLGNDTLDDSFYINRFNPEVCMDTFVSVVSEAHCGDSDDTLFLSEKIFKPIASRHPFMVMGNRGSIEKMREMGYKTFDQYIDQSYDNLPTHERLLKIVDSLKQINSIEDKIEWFKKMEDDIEYNYELLQSRINTKPPKSFEKLHNYYKNFFKVLI